MKRIIYGINPVREAMRAKGSASTIEKILVSERKKGRYGKAIVEILDKARLDNVKVSMLSDEELTRECASERHQGVAVSLAGGFPYGSLDDIIGVWKKSGERALILILDSIQDPQNMGAVIRSANAFGVHGVIVPKNRSADITSAVVRASAGATEHTLIARVSNLTSSIKRLKDEGVWVVGIEADGERDICKAEFSSTDLAIVVGSEGSGLRRLVRESCDYCVFIPMKGRINSLNAAQAGTVVLFEVLRQRALDGAGIS